MPAPRHFCGFAFHFQRRAWLRNYGEWLYTPVQQRLLFPQCSVLPHVLQPLPVELHSPQWKTCTAHKQRDLISVEKFRYLTNLNPHDPGSRLARSLTPMQGAVTSELGCRTTLLRNFAFFHVAWRIQIWQNWAVVSLFAFSFMQINPADSHFSITDLSLQVFSIFDDNSSCPEMCECVSNYIYRLYKYRSTRFLLR